MGGILRRTCLMFVFVGVFGDVVDIEDGRCSVDCECCNGIVVD